MLLALIQTVVPLLLLGWFILLPARNTLGFYLQLAAILLALVALSLVGLLTFPPWWYPRLLVPVLVCIGIYRMLGSDFLRTHYPRSVLAMAGCVFAVGLAAVSVFEIHKAIVGRRPPGPLVELAPPLAAGNYLIVNGGNTLEINAHLLTLDISRPAVPPGGGNPTRWTLSRLMGWACEQPVSSRRIQRIMLSMVAL